MENKDDNELSEDICNIARVLPNLTASTIYSELSILKNDPDRVKLILRNYFASYESQEHNCMSDDIKKIKRVLPDYPFIHINNDLLAVEHKENRVQLVLKKYFDNEVKAAKRSLLLDTIDPTDVNPGKKFKFNENARDIHTDVNSIQISNSVEKEQSSNETETESYTTEFQPTIDQSNQELESNVQDENYNTAPETSSKLELFVNVPFNTNDKNSNVSEEINDNQFKKTLEINSNSEEQKENNETAKTSLLSILSDLFPQHSIDEFKITCDDFGIDLYGIPKLCTVDLVVNSLINYCSTEEYDVEDDLQITNVYSIPDCDKQNSVTSCVETSQTGSTEDFAVGDLEHFFRSTVESSVLNDKGESNTTEQTYSIHKELVQTNNLTPQNTVKDVSNLDFDPSSLEADQNTVLNELQHFLSRIPQTGQFVNKLIPSTSVSSPNIPELSTIDKSKSIINEVEINKNSDALNFESDTIVDFNTEISQLYTNSETNQLTEPTIYPSAFDNSLVPSTCTNIIDLSITDIPNTQSPDAIINRIIKSYSSISSKKVTKPNKESDTLNFESALLNNVFPELNMSSSGTNKTVKPGLAARSNNLIKPASFHPKPSTSRSGTAGNLPRTSNSIIKPATFQPKSNKTTSSGTYSHSKLAAGLKKEFPKNSNIPLPSTSGSTYSCTSKKQDINKNTLRVRTDLYDDYFNGPVLQSSEISKETTKPRNTKKREENDDIIFVSVDHLPQKMTNVITTNYTNTNTSTPTPTNNSSSVNTINFITNCIPTNDPSPVSTKILKIEEKSTVTINDDISQPSTSKANVNHPFYFKLLEIFPDVCPDYLKKLCSKNTEIQNLDYLVSVLLNDDYKRRDRPASPETNLDFEEQHKILQDLFPDADPTYLQHHCERLIDQPDNFKQFVASIIENKNYPTKEEYLKKMKLSAQEKQYTTEFDVKKFLEVIPNPEEFFKDPKRQVSFSNFDDTNYAVTILKNTFSTTAIRDIISVFKKNNYSVLRSAIILEKINNMKTKRKPYPVTSCKNIPLLQEIAYVKHKKEILAYIKKQELQKKLEREEAKTAGLMKTCQCCFDDEVMPDYTETCESGLHIFCKDCIRKFCEVQIGDGKLDFPCLETCDSFFTLPVLQAVLTPKVFSKMAQRQQMAEVKSAGIEDLEFCPFCDFAAIPPPGDKLFRCLNSDCMKESCRLCKEPSHIPLRCDELEKDKDVKMRTYIEDKMTEALLRKCWQCGMKFIKESGCNKMTCSCGALMCYVCNQPVKDYKHFNGQGGDQTHLCPLYSDTHKLHVDAIKRGAESAKKELGVDKENQLKIDPTVDLEQHYRRLAAQDPAIPNIPVIIPQNILPR